LQERIKFAEQVADLGGETIESILSMGSHAEPQSGKEDNKQDFATILQTLTKDQAAVAKALIAKIEESSSALVGEGAPEPLANFLAAIITVAPSEELAHNEKIAEAFARANIHLFNELLSFINPTLKPYIVNQSKIDEICNILVEINIKLSTTAQWKLTLTLLNKMLVNSERLPEILNQIKQCIEDLTKNIELREETINAIFHFKTYPFMYAISTIDRDTVKAVAEDVQKISIAFAKDDKLLDLLSQTPIAQDKDRARLFIAAINEIVQKANSKEGLRIIGTLPQQIRIHTFCKALHDLLELCTDDKSFIVSYLMGFCAHPAGPNWIFGAIKKVLAILAEPEVGYCIDRAILLGDIKLLDKAIGVRIERTINWSTPATADDIVRLEAVVNAIVNRFNEGLVAE